MSNPKSSEHKEKTPTKQDDQTLERQNRALQKELGIRKKETELAISHKCRIMKVSRGFYDWRNRQISTLQMANTVFR